MSSAKGRRMHARKFLTEEERLAIDQAVTAAETKTAAEIRCAVATESGRYDHAEATVGLVFAILTLCGAHAAHWLLADVDPPGSAAPSGLALGWQVLAVTAGFVAGSVTANFLRGCRRLATSAREMELEVERAASHVYRLASVGSTSAGSGLLIYLSLFERRIVLLADARVRAALGDDGLAALRDAGVEELRAGHGANAFIECVKRAEGVLAKALPADPALDRNELPNKLIIIHPRP